MRHPNNEACSKKITDVHLIQTEDRVVLFVTQSQFDKEAMEGGADNCLMNE